MKKDLFTGRVRSFGTALAALAVTAAPAQATTTAVDTSMCTAPVLSQPLLAWQDTNWYALAPGQSVDNFTGAGWTLSGGAKILTTKLADGKTGSVLDLPSGSHAVSPTICLTSAYPSARMMVRNLSGSNGGNVGFAVSYAGTRSAVTPQQTSTFKTTGSQGVGGAFMLSSPVDLQPGTVAGWQLMHVVLTPSGSKKSEFQIYNFWVDPRMCR